MMKISRSSRKAELQSEIARKRQSGFEKTVMPRLVEANTSPCSDIFSRVSKLSLWTSTKFFEAALEGRMGGDSGPPRAAPGAGRGAHGGGEDAREMALIGKAAIIGDLPKRQARIEQQILRPLDAKGAQPSVRRHAGRIAESTDKAAHRKAAGEGDFRHDGLARKIGRERILRGPFLAWCEGAAARHGPLLEVAKP